MVAEDSDDLWYAYNLIAVGDSVMAVTFRYTLKGFMFVWLILVTISLKVFFRVIRKVQREVPGGGRDSERVRLKLEVQVEVCFFMGLVCCTFVHTMTIIVLYCFCIHMGLSLAPLGLGRCLCLIFFLYSLN